MTLEFVMHGNLLSPLTATCINLKIHPERYAAIVFLLLQKYFLTEGTKEEDEWWLTNIRVQYSFSTSPSPPPLSSSWRAEKWFGKKEQSISQALNPNSTNLNDTTWDSERFQPWVLLSHCCCTWSLEQSNKSSITFTHT